MTETRTERLEIRLTPDEREMVRALSVNLSQRAGRPVDESQTVRQAIHSLHGTLLGGKRSILAPPQHQSDPAVQPRKKKAAKT